MAEHLNCTTVLLRKKETEDGTLAEYLIREKVVEDDFCEVRYIYAHCPLLVVVALLSVICNSSNGSCNRSVVSSYGKCSVRLFNFDCYIK